MLPLMPELPCLDFFFVCFVLSEYNHQLTLKLVCLNIEARLRDTVIFWKEGRTKKETTRMRESMEYGRNRITPEKQSIVNRLGEWNSAWVAVFWGGNDFWINDLLRQNDSFLNDIRGIYDYSTGACGLIEKICRHVNCRLNFFRNKKFLTIFSSFSFSSELH